MNKTKSTSSPKTTVFNLIILDESGSMGHLTKQTVSGCNETLSIIRNSQNKAGDDQLYLASIYVFNGMGERPSRYIIKNEPIAIVNDITTRDYCPSGMTPLLDAVGATLTDLEAKANACEDATAVVTIITDGYENSSRRYSFPQIAKKIAALKELGWVFNFLGANIDVEKIGDQLNIDNRGAFDASGKGVTECFDNLKENYSRYNDDFACEKGMSATERIERRKSRAKTFFGKKNER